MKRWISFVLILVCVCMMLPTAAAANDTVTVLFTHDLHSHFEPAVDGMGNSYGGYARLKTAIDAQKKLHPDAVLVDGGDFSMGTLFQTIYASEAAELRLMGALGYDVTTFGNHEFDYRPDGFASMLHAAVDSGEPLPQIVEANYAPTDGEHQALVRDAMDAYGVKEYTVISRGGVNFAVFGINGVDSHACAPMSGMELSDPVEAAKRMVNEITEAVPEPRVVICLSHGGTDPDPKKSEDELLAKEVDGIDVIVSGHTHTTLEAPIIVNDTCIVSCGEYGKNLGVLTLSMTDKQMVSYDLIPIDDTVSEDGTVFAAIGQYKDLVKENYLSLFSDLSFDQVLADNPHIFEDISLHQEAGLGDLIADSYKWAVEQAEGENGIPVDFALTANGVIRKSLPQGAITVEQVFNMLSLGIGADGIPGYPLVSVWITGEDLKNALEVDASITSIMPAAQLHFTGMTYTANRNRMIFNKVMDCGQILEDGTVVPIEKEKLYRVVTGLYCGQMLGSVNSKSFGILNITPRDAQGNEITDLEEYIIHDSDGREIKEWYALASYLTAMGTVPEIYGAPQGRKILHDQFSLAEFLRSPNWITLIVLALAIVLLSAVILLLRRSLRKKKK